MPPERGRAGRACVACRKQKTRCYAGDRPGAACLRCNTLRQNCSFTAETEVQSPSIAVPVGGVVSSTDARLDRLESAVNLLLERLGDASKNTESRSSSPLQPPVQVNDRASVGRSRGASLDEDPIAPVFILRDLTAETGNGLQSNKQVAASQATSGFDIINAGVVSQDNAITLISIFQEHYGRWVAFDPMMPPEALLQSIRKYPLLLCACCLIAVRHFSIEAAQTLAPRLFEICKSLLSSELLISPQPIEFFQSVIVLCMWSTTAGQNPLSIDSWLISGFALQHSFSTKLFQTIVGSNSVITQSRHLLDRLRIFNHLLLVHLHYCCGTRRRSIVGRNQVEKCKELLKSDHATNFEQRMVAEVNLYWIIYEHCTGSTLDLPTVQANLHEWKRQWNFVLEQPRSQFLEMGHHFAQLLAYERALKSRSARVRDSLLNEMVRLSVAIMRLAMDNADERTAHLSDHIYHIKTFAAVTLCRLLNLYEVQLAATHDIPELDNLVIKFIDWLKSIGLPCHSGYTLGLTVAAFHKKLRPNAQPPPPPFMDLPTNDWMVESFVPSFLPDILDTEASPGGNWEWNADWEPFTAGPLT